MKKIVLSFLFLSCSFFCISQTQTELNDTAGVEYRKADNELNAVYRQLLKTYKDDTEFIKNLKKAEGIWVLLRDAEMKVKYPDRPAGTYGSVLPMCWLMYLTELTEERTKKLKEWLAGTEDGDVCAGSVDVKKVK